MIESVKRFGDLLSKGVDFLHKACQTYVEAIDKNPELRVEFAESYPEIPARAWRRFEAVGRGNLHPKLLTRLTVAALKLEQCSFSEQAKYIESPIDVLLVNGDQIKVALHNLTPVQIRQVFSTDHVRGIAEQKAYLESRKTQDALDAALAEQKAKGKTAKAYRIVHHKLVIGDVVFDKADLLRILIEMEK